MAPIGASDTITSVDLVTKLEPCKEFIVQIACQIVSIEEEECQTLRCWREKRNNF